MHLCVYIYTLIASWSAFVDEDDNDEDDDEDKEKHNNI